MEDSNDEREDGFVLLLLWNISDAKLLWEIFWQALYVIRIWQDSRREAAQNLEMIFVVVEYPEEETNSFDMFNSAIIHTDVTKTTYILFKAILILSQP